jgi:hypothetical protein
MQVSDDTKENGDHECTFEDWVDLNNKFTQAKWGELHDKDPVKGESWKRMNVLELLTMVEDHLDKYVESSDAQELIHVANYVMMAWGRDCDGCGPLCACSVCGVTKDSFTCRLPLDHDGDHKDINVRRGLVGWSQKGDVKVDCYKCGEPMIHGLSPDGTTDGCLHWFCEKCHLYNWPAGRDAEDNCPVCGDIEGD